MNPLVVLVVVLVIAPVRIPRARGRRQGRLRAGGSWKATPTNLPHHFFQQRGGPLAGSRTLYLPRVSLDLFIAFGRTDH